MKQSILFGCILSVILFVTISASAQVTIGTTNPPSSFSLLYLDASEQQRALHNARLTTDQRNLLVTPSSEPADKETAMGLLLFNTDYNCLEYWNGSQWVSLCVGDVVNPCAGLDYFDAVFCPGETIASLTARARAHGGRGLIRWYDDETGGNRFDDPNELLEARTYWADNCYGEAGRTPVEVTIATNCTQIPPLNARLTTFTNVMYDFQHQTLEAFTTGAGQATSWQWQVSANGDDWYDIPGATSSPTFMIPADFMYHVNGISALAMVKGEGVQNSLEVENNRILYFRCLMSNANTPNPAVTQGFNIHFIRTNTEGFGEDANGIRYLTINRARHLNLASNPNTIRIALLNLGQSGTGSWLNGEHVSDTADTLNDAGDLGDFHQWGRVADGHQQIVWDKNRNNVNRPNIITNTQVPRSRPMMSFDAYGQVTNIPFISNFIHRPNTHDATDWAWGEADDINLWGNGVDTPNRANSPANLFDWTDRAQRNNPCPPGWRVPSRFDWSDMHTGTGTNNSGTTSPGTSATGNNNTWLWRGYNTGAVGGIILTNNLTRESVFLPAAGRRGSTQGTFDSSGTGIYWTSTVSNLTNSAFTLRLRAANVEAGVYAPNRTTGYSVRCVQ